MLEEPSPCSLISSHWSKDEWEEPQALNVFYKPLTDTRDTPSVVVHLLSHQRLWGLPRLNIGDRQREPCVITSRLQTPYLLLCQDGGHLGVVSDILSNCIILLSMLTGYVIFHRSVPIIRARLSWKDPPDVCGPFTIGLSIVAPQNHTSLVSTKVLKSTSKKMFGGG